MTDLETRIGSLTLPNPVIVSSSEFTMYEANIKACLDAGAGAVVAKSVNELPAAAQQLDIADYVPLTQSGAELEWNETDGTESLFNRSGLAQAPLDKWLDMLDRCQRYAAGLGSAVIGSVTVGDAQAAAKIAAAMAQVVPAVEINVGAPHAKEAKAVRQAGDGDAVRIYTRAVRQAVSCPLLVKLPAQAGDLVAMARAAHESGADSVGLTGRFNGFMPNLDTWEPALGSWGAIGGQWSMPTSLYWISKVHNAFEPTIVGSNGARTGSDVARFLLSGATAVEMASRILADGAPAVEEVLAELIEYLTAHRVERVADIVGESARRARTYADITPAVPPLRPWEPVDGVASVGIRQTPDH